MKSIFKKLSAIIIMLVMVAQMLPSSVITSSIERVVESASAQSDCWDEDSSQYVSCGGYTWTFDQNVTTSNPTCYWGCSSTSPTPASGSWGLGGLNDNSFNQITCWDGSRTNNYSDCPRYQSPAPSANPASNSWEWQDTCAINPSAIGCVGAANSAPAPSIASVYCSDGSVVFSVDQCPAATTPTTNNNSWTWQDTCATNPSAVGCSGAANTYWCAYTGSYVQSAAYCPTSTGPVPTSAPTNNSWSWQTAPQNVNTYWCNTTSSYVQSAAYCPSIQYPTIVYSPTIVSTPAFTNYSWGSWGTAPTTVVTPVTQQYRCWDNSIVTAVANCPTQTKVCSGGIVVPVAQNCPAQTKVCPNGNVIAIDQVCPAQTKPCANGTVVGINDICYKTCPNGYTYPESATCPVQTCSNGAINAPTCNQCSTGLEYVNNKCLQPCASGYTRNGESCDRVTYRCAGGQIVYNMSDCPATTCNNGATNPPTCNQFPSCTNGAINSPTCSQCAQGYEFWSNRCVAVCQTNYIRNSSTGACDPRACTNGAVDAPNCNSCPNGQEMVSGSCVNVCPANTYRTSSGCTPYTCTNGATNYAWCNICPTGKYMINGSCQSCQTGQSYDGYQCVNNQCSNGAINSPNCNLCSNGYEFVNNKCLQPCPNGYIRNGDSCNLIPQNSCTNGAINPSSCNQCATGYEMVQGRCLQICPTGYIRSGLNCQMETRICWDNSQVILSQACPPQYKYCPGSGTSVLVTQSCPIVPVTPNPVPTPPVVTTHRVITTSASMITDTSARCNGIGIISNSKNSNGWFEYGTTPALGYNTQVGYIGSASNVNYAAPITNLKPSTTYYCRAVMSNIDGTWKGDIVSFSTSAAPVKYVEQPKPIVKPIVTPAKTNKTDIEKITYTSTTYTCKDTSGGTVDVKSGDKLMSINLVRDSSNIYSSKNSAVKVEYENTSKINLTDVELRVSIPSEVEVVSTSQGSYDSTLKEVRVNLKELAAGQTGVILLTIKAKNSAENGKTVVLTGYANYFLTTSSGDAYKDETSSYVIYQIVNDGDSASQTSNNNTTVKKSSQSSTSSGFLPSTFLGWLSLIIILFVLVIIGRTLWGVWKGKSAAAHH